MKRKAVLLAAGLVTAFACTAQAQISPIGPFTGTMQEGFEAVPGYACPPCFFPCFNGVFGGNANMCDLNPGGNGMHATGGWGFQCSISPHGGGWLFGSAGGATEITFNSPIQKFGGYFGDNGLQINGTAEFFDSTGTQIGAFQALSLNGCIWVWNGWESTTNNIKKIIVRGAVYGGHILLDDMEASAGASCYPDCNGDTLLNLADFGCFQTKFAIQDPYADCNGDTLLNLADFGCFQTKFAIGCP